MLYHLACAVQSQETPLHYCGRTGNVDVLMEVMKRFPGPQLQAALNRPAKVMYTQSRHSILWLV